jgi:hypothetical protein
LAGSERLSASNSSLEGYRILTCPDEQAKDWITSVSIAPSPAGLLTVNADSPGVLTPHEVQIGQQGERRSRANGRLVNQCDAGSEACTCSDARIRPFLREKIWEEGVTYKEAASKSNPSSSQDRVSRRPRSPGSDYAGSVTSCEARETHSPRQRSGGIIGGLLDIVSFQDLAQTRCIHRFLIVIGPWLVLRPDGGDAGELGALGGHCEFGG